MYFSIVPQSFNVCRWGACISRGICHYVVWRMVEEQWLRWKCPFISLLFLLCLLENWVPFWNSEVPNSAPIVEEISSFLASCASLSLLRCAPAFTADLAPSPHFQDLAASLHFFHPKSALRWRVIWEQVWGSFCSQDARKRDPNWIHNSRFSVHYQDQILAKTFPAHFFSWISPQEWVVFRPLSKVYVFHAKMNIHLSK